MLRRLGNKDNRITKVDVVEQKDWICSAARPSPTEKDKRMRPADRITAVQECDTTEV